MTVPRATGALARGRLAGLSVVVPAYNEAANLPRVLGELQAVLPAVAVRAEIVVVDDGSVDDTALAASRSQGVRVVRHATNLGYGAALRTGFASGREPWVFFTDGDGQFDLRELGRLVAGVGGADLVAGYRVARADPLFRRAAGWAWSHLVHALLGVRARDVNCAFKLVRREVLDAVALQADGAAINAELLGKALRCGWRVRYVPVSHRPRVHGRATGGSPRVILAALREILGVALALRTPGATRRSARGHVPGPSRAAGMLVVAAALWSTGTVS